MIAAILSLFSPKYPVTVTYMLQSTEYHSRPYLKWYWRTNNFSSVAKRRSLDRTRPARLLLMTLKVGMYGQALMGLVIFLLGLFANMTGGVQLGAALLISYPVVWAHLIVVPLALGRYLIIRPKERLLVARSKEIFANHKGVKIAVAGSYGKTTMKELLLTVLDGPKVVAATPGNKNVSVSHAAFAARLKGDEDVLVIEYGEGQPGDVKRFARTTKPDYGVITGVAPAHLDKYKTVEAAGRDIFSLADYLKDDKVYVNGESPDAKRFIKPKHFEYSAKGVAGWKVTAIKVSQDSTKFTMKKGVRTFKLTSGLIGRHQVGPLACVAAIANELGLTKKQIEDGIAKTVAYEHRLQSYHLAGAQIIDDTYNGNIEGVKVGLALLKELSARRKIYVTPGLVDQGKEAKPVHYKMGELIAKAKPDIVILMENSTTKYIEMGLKEAGYTGDLMIEPNPLKFYTNLSQFVAANDVVLMQNDWTDNYA